MLAPFVEGATGCLLRIGRRQCSGLDSKYVLNYFQVRITPMIILSSYSRGCAFEQKVLQAVRMRTATCWIVWACVKAFIEIFIQQLYLRGTKGFRDTQQFAYYTTENYTYPEQGSYIYVDVYGRY